jgi:thioredoxin 1
MKMLRRPILLVVDLLLVLTACTLVQPVAPDSRTGNASPPSDVSDSTAPPPTDADTPELSPTPASASASEPTLVPTTASATAPTRSSTATVVKITEANYQDEVLQAPVPVLIHFGADWAGPSRVLAPTMDALAQAYAGRVKVGKVNVDENPALAKQFTVTKLPTVILIKDGSEQARISGVTSN